MPSSASVYTSLYYNKAIQSFVDKSSNLEIALWVIIPILFLFILHQIIFRLIFPKYKFVHKLGYPNDRKFIFSTNKWVEKEAIIIRFDFSNLEGGNLVSKKELTNYTEFTPRIDCKVAVVEYKNDINGKNVPVVVFPNNANLKVGDIVKIKINPAEPFEAFII